MLIIIATLATTDVSAGAVAKADQKAISHSEPYKWARSLDNGSIWRNSTCNENANKICYRDICVSYMVSRFALTEIWYKLVERAKTLWYCSLKLDFSSKVIKYRSERSVQVWSLLNNQLAAFASLWSWWLLVPPTPQPPRCQTDLIHCNLLFRMHLWPPKFCILATGCLIYRNIKGE